MDIILIIPDNIKKDIIEKVRSKYYNKNIKFMSLEEFIRRYTFDYNEKTMYYLMKKYNYNYDSAKMILDNLIYISDNIDNDKMKLLRDVKEYLDSNNLLIYDKLFCKYIVDKEIYIYGYGYIKREDLDIISNLNVKVIPYEYNNYDINNIYEFDSINDEVIFVCNRIANLIKKGIDIHNIKIIYSNEYINILKRMFYLYNIPITINDDTLYSCGVIKKLLSNLSCFSIEDIKDGNILDKVINIFNKYSFVDDYNDVRELIIHDFMNTKVYPDSENTSSVEDVFSEDDHVFLMGFNKENYPIIHKDNDFFSDKDKDILNMSNSVSLNKMEREMLFKCIHNIENLTITYKLYDDNGVYTKCDVLEDVSVLKCKNDDYSNSILFNKIMLGYALDDLIKYNVIRENTSILYNNYKDINYRGYNNSFNGIDKDIFYKYLNNKLSLSYTSMNEYNECKFKYYIDYILKLNVIEDDFPSIIGTMCHYLLSMIDKEDFDIDVYYNRFLKNVRVLDKREEFFLDCVKNSMVLIIDIIEKQREYTSLDKELCEKRIFVSKDREIQVVFTGVIDKVLYKEDDDKTYIAIIDYKTGNNKINIDNIDLGIELQLPIYLYLSSKLEFKNIVITGFYLQKLFNSIKNSNVNYRDALEDGLKLEGYSNSNENILSMLDKTYNNSKLIKSMRVKNDGNFYSGSKVVSSSDITSIIDKTNDVIDRTIDSIISADFSINPKIIDNENVSCKYCKYSDICFVRNNDITYINTQNIDKESDCYE